MIDPKPVLELATGRFLANGENVLLFGPPGVGKTHLAIGVGRACVEAGHSVLVTSATALLAALSKAENEGQLNEKLTFFAKPKLLVIDELGTCRSSVSPRTSSSSSSLADTSEEACSSRQTRP